jgi:hypothetical protein
MTLHELLQKNSDAIVRRWLDAALSTYSQDASVAFARQKDPFANPVGHCLRVGTQGIFAALLEGADAERIVENLREIVRIRAVQEFSPSDAIGFLFRLKDIVRTELGSAARDAKVAAELTKFDGQVDRVALAAFDLFVECRQQVCELRINEVKRRVAWVMEKMGGCDSEPELVHLDPE